MLKIMANFQLFQITFINNFCIWKYKKTTANFLIVDIETASFIASHCTYLSIIKHQVTPLKFEQYVLRNVKDMLFNKITGRQCRSKQGKTIYSFKGIPYAQPPIGHLRFERPKQLKPWRKTLDLTGNSIRQGLRKHGFQGTH